MRSHPFHPSRRPFTPYSLQRESDKFNITISKATISLAIPSVEGSSTRRLGLPGVFQNYTQKMWDGILSPRTKKVVRALMSPRGASKLKTGKAPMLHFSSSHPLVKSICEAAVLPILLREGFVEFASF